MIRRSIKMLFALSLAAGLYSSAEAKGRRPSDDDDKFPDYNRLEMRPKPKPAPAEQPKPPAASPSFNAPANFSTEDDALPKPPPKAVPLPIDSSEPPMPDDLMNTLIPPATSQTPPQ